MRVVSDPLIPEYVPCVVVVVVVVVVVGGRGGGVSLCLSSYRTPFWQYIRTESPR